ncbi:MAG: putative DMT superfamily transporter inner membrane protein [bacterium ADurb.Bin478]|nr:MAG: putative DMT superfamily transporter inner membrane protein [bacterium ADurb.Bin478]
MQSRVFKSDALLLLTAMIWGSTFVVQRIGMDHVGPFTFTATRFLLGGLCLLPLMLRRSAPSVEAPLATEARGIIMAGLLLLLAEIVLANTRFRKLP